MFCFCIENEL
ncbi:BnaC06g41180D [Brassica napus]|uniref:BnaC06g41180D protein n=1 Tax=Brassica napus TaxID=3708 RepID=A0A078IYI1_BRANA|nr:BnaC06g41180D [Brassica napus]